MPAPIEHAVIGLDTNVLVRYITQDDPGQAARATRLVESFDEDHQGFVSLVTLVELYWVLRRAYGTSRAEANSVVHNLLSARELTVQHADVVHRALTKLDGEADFADALVGELGVAAECSHTVTFDRRGVELPGMRLITDER